MMVSQQQRQTFGDYRNVRLALVVRFSLAIVLS